MVEINENQNTFKFGFKCKNMIEARVCCHIHRRPFYQANHQILCTNHSHVKINFNKMVL